MFQQTIAATKRSIVRIRSGGMLGSGFMIEGGFIATARHLIQDVSDIVVEGHPGPTTTGRLLDSPLLSGRDLALIQPVELDLPPLELGDFSAVHEGDEVLFAGFPLFEHMPLTFQKGMVSHVGEQTFPPQIPQPVQCLQLDASVNLGNSGGPVMNVSGHVVAVINARLGRLTKFLEQFLAEQVASREVSQGLGMGGAIQMGVIEIGGRRFKQFDTAEAQQALIDIIGMLHLHMNVGIGWAISVCYLGESLEAV